jgi:hypothetical protein
VSVETSEAPQWPHVVTITHAEHGTALWDTRAGPPPDGWREVTTDDEGLW